MDISTSKNDDSKLGKELDLCQNSLTSLDGSVSLVTFRAELWGTFCFF